MLNAKILATLRLGLSAIKNLLPMKRRLTAERSAGQTPFSAPADRADPLLDEALLRLGLIKADDPLWKRLVQDLGAAVTRPELFEKPHIREWLSIYDVGLALKGMAKARAVGGPIDAEAHKRLVATYMDRSGEDQRHAEEVIDTALAFLQASLQYAATDSGTSGLLQSGFQGVHKRFDGLEERVSELGEQTGFIADGVVAEHHGADAKKELEDILRRRGTAQHDTLTELQELASHLSEKGKYKAAIASIKSQVFFWIARLAANKGTIEMAESALSESKKYGMHDTAIIDSWLDVARGDVNAAIRRLRAREDADSRSNLFAILWQKKSARSALEFFDSLGYHPADQFTALGWRNIAACSIAENRLQDILNILGSLPEPFVTECPMLGYVQGVVYALNIVPEAYRHRIINEQYLAVTDHLLEGAEADRWRKVAAEAFFRAKLAAEHSHDMFLPRMAANWMRWLRLIDSEERENEVIALKAGMEHGSSAVDMIDFAVAFNVEYDSSPLEKHLFRAEKLGGLSRQELNAKFLLLKSTRRFEELVRTIEENWGRLSYGDDAGALTGLLIETLVECGNWRRAEEILAEGEQVLYPLDIPRYRLMIDHCKGGDPTKLAFENYENSGSIEDLWNLVKGLEHFKRWDDLAVYSKKLFEEEPTSENALRYIRTLHQIGAPEDDVIKFLENDPELIHRNPDLKSAKAWALYHLGQVEESRKLNDQLLASRHHVNDIGLDVNIAMRAGEWERFTDILGREWERRNDLPVSILLHMARLAGTRAPERAIQLAQEAVERDPADPYVLLGASGIATALARDDVAMPWVHQASTVSATGEGPVQQYSFREVFEIMRNNADAWRRKNELFNNGQIPLHWAAPMFNMPLSRFLIAMPRENIDQPDARKRYTIPVRSGARRQITTSGINRLALDITSIFILSELGLLDTVIDALHDIFVSPRVMELLLFEREKVAFHQPSRIRAAKPLLEMRRTGQLAVITKKASEALVAEVGEEQAVLLESAKEGSGISIHGGRLYKVGSFMDEEAELGDFEGFLAVPSAIAVTLYEEGRISTAAFEKARAYLDSVGGTYLGSAITPGALICLDQVSAQYLSEAGVLVDLINSGRKVYIHPGAAEEWEALVATERHTAAMEEALESIRRSLRSGMASGKVHFLREGGRKDEDESRGGLATLPMIDLLEDVGEVDAVCIDDRLLNIHPRFTDKKGRSVTLLCTTDILDLLIECNRLDTQIGRQVIHSMRQRGLFAMPLKSDELLDLLSARTLDDNGDIKESAELRAIRESLAGVHSADVLTTAADLNYLDQLWRVGYDVIRELWAEEAMSVDLVVARANWIVDHVMPDIELALRFAPNKEERIESLAASRMLAFLLPGITLDRKQQYAEWLENKVVSLYLPANTKVIEQSAAQIAKWVIASSREVADEIRKSGSIANNSEPTEDNS